MSKEILDYISSQRICVLAVEMMDGAPHAATVHFAHQDDPLMFFFETDKRYKKSEPLFGKQETRASIVIGSNEANMKTFQMDGIARLIKDSEADLYENVYHGKFPEKLGKSVGENYVCFLFVPNWWRFTDWTKPEGKLILTSTDKTK